MGRESSEKAFHRWMKIFETFPEGIALIRNNYILYANRALKYILNIGINRINSEEDPLYELLKVDLKQTNVQQWVKSQTELKRMGLSAPKQMSVWHFLMHNEKGAIFCLMPKKRPQSTQAGSHPVSEGGPRDSVLADDIANKEVEKEEAEMFGDILDDYLAEIPRYITLN
jgi:hypothetical protein